MKQLIEAGNAYVGREMAEVEEMLQKQLDSEISTVADLGKYLVESGGKRFRPALALFFYKLLGEQGSREAVIELAAIIEMVHLATLVHDDVIDGARWRRDRPTLWVRANSQSAVLEGDFIFSRAFRLLNPFPFDIRTLVIEAVDELLEGELLQESLRWNWPTMQEYVCVIERKTAALISTACSLGAMMGNPDLAEWQRDAIVQAGRRLGSAYQMVDDLLDVFGDEAMGKPRWTDQQGGWLTWPYIRFADRCGDPGVRERLINGQLSGAEKDDIVDRMERQGIRAQFGRLARQSIAEAKDHLAWIPDSELKRLLLESFDFVVARNR